MGYKAISIPQTNRIGGGLAIIHKESINLKHNNDYNLKTVECSDFTITTSSYSIHQEILYRPPEGSVLQFSWKLVNFLEQHISSAGELLLMGVLNIQVNCDNNPDTITLLDTYESFGLKNHVNFSTHHLQNTLYLILTQGTCSLISPTSHQSLLSDHNIIHYKLQTLGRVINLKEITFRKHRPP